MFGFADGTIVGRGLVVMPPDSEVVAPVSVRSSSGIQPGPCSLVEPCMDLMEGASGMHSG